MSFFDARMKVLIKNVFGSAAARFVNLFITLAMVPLTINALSPTDYAYFAMAISLSILAAYADLGMGLAVVNVIAERGAKTKSGRAQRAVSVVWFSLLGIAAIGLLLTLSIAVGVNLTQPTEALHRYNAMLLAAGCVFAGLPTGLVQRVLFAEQKNIQANAWSTGARITSLGVVWVMVNTGNANLLMLTFAVIGVPVIIGWCSVVFTFGQAHIKELRPKLKHYDFRLIKPYLIIGFSYLVLQSVPFVETGMDSLLIGNLIDINQVQAFDVFLKLFTYVPALVSISVFPVWPAIANAKASGEVKWIYRARKFGYIFIFLISTSTSIIFIINSSTILKLWTGKDFILSNNSIIGLGVFSILASLGLFQAMILNGFGKIKEQAKIYLVYIFMLLITKICIAGIFGVTGIIWTLNLFYFARLFLSEKLLILK